METNYMSLNIDKQETKKTIFKKCVSSTLEIFSTVYKPCDFENVLFIGNDKYYGDVFKAWNDERDFYILFGTAGDEFKK